MRQTHTLCLLALIAGCTAWQNLLPHQPVAALLGRQDGECTIQSTCAQCFGEGSVICDNIGCYNPNKHEQCCSGACMPPSFILPYSYTHKRVQAANEVATAICVGKDNSCCSAWGGPGVSGTAGVPNATAAETAPAPTTSDVSWECTRLDSGEQCCQRAPIPLHWCSGDYPSQRCYNPKNQFCCTDGTVCDEKDCCALFVCCWAILLFPGYVEAWLTLLLDRVDYQPVPGHDHQRAFHDQFDQQPGGSRQYHFCQHLRHLRGTDDDEVWCGSRV